MSTKSGSCGACAFFDERDPAKAGHQGLCRFNPPVSQPAPEAQGLWPVVTEQDWCGHFAPEAVAGAAAAE